MAIAEVNFFSASLSRYVTYKAIIPVDDGPPSPGMKQDAKEFKPLRTLYLLHGFYGDYNDWLTKSRIAQLAPAHRIAVILPSGDNRFYVDQEATGDFYGEFIGKELVEHTRKLFPLSQKREDTFICGLSMGGYGALRNGLKYNDTFGAAIGLSSAIILENTINSTNEAPWRFARKAYYEGVFGDLSSLMESDKNPEELVRRIKKQNGVMPRLYIACGTEDTLVKINRKLKDFLDAESVENTYLESPGIHDWKFWDEYIEKALYWLGE